MICCPTQPLTIFQGYGISVLTEVKHESLLYEVLFAFALDAETNSVCEIVHVKSESEGRPERTFHLCCR